MKGGQLVIKCAPQGKAEISLGVEKDSFFNLAPFIKSARIKAKGGEPTEIRINLTEDCTEEKHPLLVEISKLILADPKYQYAWNLDESNISYEFTEKQTIDPTNIEFKSTEAMHEAMTQIHEVLLKKRNAEDIDWADFAL